MVKEKGRKRAPLTACDIPISCSVHPNPPVQIASRILGVVEVRVRQNIIQTRDVCMSSNDTKQEVPSGIPSSLPQS